MRKLFCSALILAVVACSKAPVVEVTAAFTTNKDVYQVGEEVFIENTSNVVNDILAFCIWECEGAEGDPVHYVLNLESLTYNTPGIYTIKLTSYAEAGAGQDTYSKQILVTDENDTPWAFFECPAVVKVGEEVLFEDKSADNIGGVNSWHWDINGQVYEIQSPLLVFDAPATGVTVKLTVTDVYGASDSFSRIIDIIE
jgi:PKD repeat protein